MGFLMVLYCLFVFMGFLMVLYCLFERLDHCSVKMSSEQISIISF
jgi:hypothetical protein